MKEYLRNTQLTLRYCFLYGIAWIGVIALFGILLLNKRNEYVSNNANTERNTIKFHQYDITQSCTYPTNRTNPRYEDLKCAVTAKLDLNIPYLSDKFPSNVYSNVKCSDKDRNYCEYTNVCVADKQILFYPDPEEVLNQEHFRWYPYKFPRSKAYTFSWNYDIKIQNETSHPSKLNRKIKWVKGRHLWFDQTFQGICHVGHSSEFYFKAPHLRKLFPGKVDSVIYSHTSGNRMCYHVCNMMRLAFWPEDFVIPPIYLLQESPEYKQSSLSGPGDLMCFETLLVPALVHQMFPSHEAADTYREQGLRMCNIPERQSELDKPTRIMFHERGWNRQIFNAPDLCDFWKELIPETFLETDDYPDFCGFMAMVHSSDIIITVEGSQNHMLAFARPGTVVILVSPYHFRLPDWKVMNYWSRLRTLDIITVDRRYSISHKPVLDDPGLEEKLSATMIQCYGDPCRFSLQDRDTYIPLKTMNMFIDYAFEIWNKWPPHPCEKPLPWPVPDLQSTITSKPHWWVFDIEGLHNNYAACEPPYPNCICCKHKECTEATSIDRVF